MTSCMVATQNQWPQTYTTYMLTIVQDIIYCISLNGTRSVNRWSVDHVTLIMTLYVLYLPFRVYSVIRVKQNLCEFDFIVLDTILGSFYHWLYILSCWWDILLYWGLLCVCIQHCFNSYNCFNLWLHHCIIILTSFQQHQHYWCSTFSVSGRHSS